MIKIYHNPRCRKSRDGLALLENSGKKFEVIKYLENIPSKEELKQIVECLGITPLQLVRKNEAIWKELYKNKNLSDDDVLEAMVAHPKLMERPIVIAKSKAVIGRPTEKINSIIDL